VEKRKKKEREQRNRKLRRGGKEKGRNQIYEDKEAKRNSNSRPRQHK